MIHWLVIALGGAIGAVARAGLSYAMLFIWPQRFPWPTLTANVLGCLAMGFLYVLILEKALLNPEWRQFLMVGFLGAFTTFSTFSIEVLNLWQSQHISIMAIYIVVSMALCLLAVTLGYALAHKIF